MKKRPAKKKIKIKNNKHEIVENGKVKKRKRKWWK